MILSLRDLRLGFAITMHFVRAVCVRFVHAVSPSFQPLLSQCLPVWTYKRGQRNLMV